MAEFGEVEVTVFDATSARARQVSRRVLRAHGKTTVVDLTPAAIGPYVVPTVNLDEHLHRPASTWSPAAGRPPCRSSPPSTR